MQRTSNWTDVHSLTFDKARFGNSNWVANGPSYTIKRIELQLVARVTDGLALHRPLMSCSGVTPASAIASSAKSGAPSRR